jgi:haloalkane dehalogenase
VPRGQARQGGGRLSAGTGAGVLRTDEARFAGLDLPYAPRYVEVRDERFGPLRMAAIDEGPRAAPVALLLHGEPSWSYLYRHVIPPVVAAGFRAVAPDFVGFGRSDKLPGRGDYSYAGFVGWLHQFVEALDLTRITLVCQDWGGPIGLSVLAQMPERFAGVLAANTLLPNCEAPPRGVAGWPGKVIEEWAAFAAAADDMPVSAIIGGVSRHPLTAQAQRAYDAPFPDARYKAAALAFPPLIPIREDMPGIAENRRVWQFLEGFSKPFLTAFSDADPTTAPWAEVFRARVPGAQRQPHAVIAGAGHFLQEDAGAQLAEVLVAMLRRAFPKA